MSLPFECHGRTDVGLYRQNNEDAFAIEEALGLFLLADGMGGHASGEVASGLALEVAQGYITRALKMTPTRSRQDILVKALETANQLVFQEAAKSQALHGMGTTIVALLHDQGVMHLAHVGDSRCYRLRNDQLEQLTIDHSLRNFYIYQYGYTPEEAAALADSNVILRAIGLKETTTVDAARHTIKPGDLYLLCSDGLSDYVEPEQILEVLASLRSLEQMTEALVGLANGAGGYDNTTVLLVRGLAAP